MSQLTEVVELQRLRETIRPVCERHSVAKLELFGSRAEGRSRPGSDFDFLVEFSPQAKAGLLEMGGLKEDLEDQLGRPVDLLTRRAVERSRNPCRRRLILSSPILVYAR